MTDDTSPAMGPASTGEDFRIISVTVEPKLRIPMVEFFWKGKSHTRSDEAMYDWAKYGKWGLTSAHAEKFKEAGIKCRKEHGLAPWGREQDTKAPTAAPVASSPPRAEDKPRPTPAARKVTPPAHTFKILGEPYNEGGYTWVKFEHDGKEDVQIVQQLYEDTKNFPDQFPPQAEGEARDLWISVQEARTERITDERGIEWPRGGIEPITADTFTEARALEVGIIYANQRGIMRVSIHEAARYIMDHISFANIRTGRTSTCTITIGGRITGRAKYG